MAADMSSFLNPALCANTERVVDGTLSPCQNPAPHVCGSCKLVQYCSRDCQIANWRQHKKICKSALLNNFTPDWVREGRLPIWVSDTAIHTNFGVNQYLWGNMPALDILNMKDNEGVGDTNRDISLLFAASGDIRNVVKAVVGLPEGYAARCSVVVNDWNFVVVARNTMMLLTALHLEPGTAVPIMIHLWYSALMPASMVQVLQDSVLPYVDDVCNKIKDKDPGSLQAKTFTVGKKSLRLTLKQREWNQLRDCFTPPKGLSAQRAQEIRRRIMLAPERVDYLHRALNNQPTAMRAGTVQFREDGILLPHGTSRKDFDTPNPTFFQDPNVWPMMDDASPLDGWDYAEHIKHAPKATNDVYGSLFFFLRDLLLRFCNRVQEVDIQFRLFSLDARKLPVYMKISSKEEAMFDRIEIANICDRGYLGPKATLDTFAPCLKPKSENPKAALLMLFLNAVAEVYHNNPRLQTRSIKDSMQEAKKFITVTPTMAMAFLGGMQAATSDPEMIRLSSCYTLFGDFDEAFDVFLEETQMDRLAGTWGLKAREKHSIVDPWPLRVTNNTTQEEFQLSCASSHTCKERYVEFERI